MQKNDIATSKIDDQNGAREDILRKIRLAQGANIKPSSDRPIWKTPARLPGSPQAELRKLFSEITALGGSALQLQTSRELQTALEGLVAGHHIQRATLWETPSITNLQIGKRLAELGVEIVSPHADRFELAECDLGVTGVDCALPETGTLVLCSTREQPLAVSLLPRIHLAILDPAVLRLDLDQALAEFRGRRLVCVTGPSRTADIEMTLSIGVHGPGILIVWALGEGFSAG